MRRIRFTENRFWLAMLIAAIAFGGIVTYVQAVSLIQTSDNGGAGTNNSWNRALVCSATTELCYALGGGTSASGTNDDTYFYTPSTDTWATLGVAELPTAYRFAASAQGANNGLIWATETSSTTYNTLLYNESTDSWSTIADPVGFNAGFGFVGVNAGSQYYLMRASGNIFTAYSMDMENTGAGWSSNQAAYTDATLLQDAKAVYDPENNIIVIITRDDGLTWVYDITTGQLTDGLGSVFPPCNGAGMGCYASVFFYDASLGLVAGKQGDPSSTTIGLYRFNPTTNTWSASTVETLSNANFNYLPLTNSGPKESFYTSPNTGITTLMFGSGWTPAANPGVSANRWWLRTGDPGGITTVERDFDSWLNNFLSSMGMNSPVGRLLIGSLFAGVLFFVLTIKGVPWIMSLGITGFAVVTMTAAMVFDPAILLGLIAIVGLGSLGLMFSLFIGGGNRE